MLDRESAGAGESAKGGVVVLVRILGMNRFALIEGNLVVVDENPLRIAADEMHLDAARALVVERAVRERSEVERSAELAIDAAEEIEIEGGSDAEGIVVCGLEDRARLAKISAQEKSVAGNERGAQ